MRSKCISCQDIAAPVADNEVGGGDEYDEVQVILDNWLEHGVSYLERRRAAFSKAVVQLQQTDIKCWTTL